MIQKITLEFNSEEELNSWKKSLVHNAVIEEHQKKFKLIDDIIQFAVNFPNDMHALDVYTQIGGDTLEEYFASPHLHDNADKKHLRWFLKKKLAYSL